MHNLILANKRKIIILLTLVSGFACYSKTSLANSITIEDNAKIKDSQIIAEEYEGNVHEKYNLIQSDNMQLTSYLPSILTHYEKFVDRQQELKKIEEYFLTNQVVVITGRGGLGKSSLATWYGKHKKSNLQLTRYFNADSVSKIDQAYQELAKELNINTTGQSPSMIMRLVHNKLINLPKDMLFIFDNVQQYDDIKDYLVNLPSNVKILITTRQSDLIPEVPSIILDEFDNESAKEYLAYTLNNRLLSNQDMEKVINNAGSLPYDLKCTVAYILNNSLIPTEKLISELDGKIKGKLFEEFAISNDKVKQQAWQILQYAAYLDPDFISVEIIKELFSNNEDDLSKAVKKLESLSLISIIHDSNDQLGFRIHRKLQQSVLYTVKNHPEYSIHEQKLVDNLFAMLNKLFPKTTSVPDNKWQIASNLEPHARKLLNLSEQSTNEDNKLKKADLYYKLSMYNSEVNINYKQALRDGQEALNLERMLYKEYSSEIADILNLLGKIYRKSGNATLGLDYALKGLEIRQALYKTAHPDIASSLHNLGVTYKEIGEPEKGLEYAKMALEMRQDLYKGNHPDIASSLSNVGGGYSGLALVTSDDFKQSIKYLEESLKMHKALYEGNHPNTAYVLHGISWHYYRLKNYVKAIEYIKQSVSMYESLYPGGHPYTADALGTFGKLLILVGDTDKGIDLLNHSLNMVKNFNMDNHFVTAFTCYDLGVGYFKKGDYNKALEYAEKALTLRRKIYVSAKNHLEIVESLHSLGDIHLALNNKAKASEFYNEALTMSLALSLDDLSETRELQEKVKGLQDNK